MIFNLLSCLTQTYPTINIYEIWFCGCVIAKQRLVTFVICNCTKLPRMSDIYYQLLNIMYARLNNNVSIRTCVCVNLIAIILNQILLMVHIAKICSQMYGVDVKSICLYYSSKYVVPVVMGGRQEDYDAIAPPHSFIHVDAFTSPKFMADYLLQLDKNDDLYDEYFKWKNTGSFVNTKFWCRMCAMLHDVNKPVTWFDDVSSEMQLINQLKCDFFHNLFYFTSIINTSYVW